MAVVSSLLVSSGGTATPLAAPIAAHIRSVKISEQALKGLKEYVRLRKYMEAAKAPIATTRAISACAGPATGASSTTIASSIATANIWNPIGWTVGSILVGAEMPELDLVTWACYKPILGQSVDDPSAIEPITLATLAESPNVREVNVGTCAVSAGLPDIYITNTIGEDYLLRGVFLPCGAVAYHANRILA
ncbi:uncharacterized protein FTOL_04504 [Fusarium torulosum]|uniref:Uncharacterized protein n=1 Tax=Fusarium torulosum TaxID=33205 RepID=A0AAE8SG63_9HYPO|nr:uncharacterized protein FTOL_04504 [Fusarium torulosum]